jgi:tetratricopeptide (TPR) repeat protein
LAKRRAHWLFYLVALGAVLAVGALIGVTWYTWYHSMIAVDNREFISVTRIARDDNANNDFTGAATVWNDYANTTPSKTHKNAAYVNAAAQYISGGEFNKAIQECKMSEAIAGVTFEEAEVAATANAAAGNKTDAIKYYEDAIRLIPNAISDRTAEITTYNQAIKQLQSDQ